MTNYEIARDIVDSEWKKNANLNPYIIEKKIQEALDQKDSTIQVLREEVERLKNSVPGSVKSYIAQVEHQQKELQSLRAENAAINECHEGDSKYITKLRDTIKELGEYLKKIITYGSPHNKDWDCIDVAKEALSNPIVKQVMEKVYQKEDV